MKKTLPDEVFYFTMISLETEGTQRLKCHLQLHLGLGKLSAIFDLHGSHIIFKSLWKVGRKEGRREGRRKGKEGGREGEREKGGREEGVVVITK